MNIFDNIDNNINPKNDFYAYATGNWLKNNPQLKEYPDWNVFVQLNDKNIERVNDIIQHAGKDDSIVSQKINTLYNIIMNWDRRNKEGIKPLTKYMENIVDHVYSNKDIIRSSAKNRIELFFNTGLVPDSKGSGKYEVSIYQGGLGLGNKDYYINDTEDNHNIQKAYITYIKDVFLKFGLNGPLAAKLIYEIEYELAKLSYSEEQLQDPILNYNRMSVKKLSKETDFNWDMYLKDYGYKKTKYVIVSNLEFLKVACKLLRKIPFHKLKYFYMWNIMNMGISTLNDELYDISFEFSKVFTGATEQIPKWKRAVSAVNSLFSDPIGQIYVEKYFSEQSKKDVKNLINNMKYSFGEIIKKQTWMSEQTIKTALDKLYSMKLKIGYPNEFEDYSDMPISSDLSYFDNIIKINDYLFNIELEDYYNQKIDPDDWFMSPHSVNAYYDPIQNEICFPAGILQYPFYDPDRNAAENYGGIGTIIAHEMTHAFDNHGRLYDKYGTLNDWWFPGDADKFNKLTENTKIHFNNLEAIPGIMCNGSLTLGENLADYGGLKIAYNACKEYMESNYINNDDWQNHFFIAYANNWAGIMTDESIKTSIITNEHTIDRLRVNGTLPLFDEWIKYYGLTDNDKLYVKPEKRAKIW